MVITTSPLVKTYTLQEFWDLPEPADRSKLELIKGVLYMTPPPGDLHNEAATDLHDLLRDEIKRCGYRGKIYFPRTSIWVDEGSHLEPDLMYISDELKAQMLGRFTRADIVVEISSPSTWLYDAGIKSETYLRMGVRELWLVDIVSKEIEVKSLEAGKRMVYNVTEVLRSEVLPNIEISVSELMQS